MKMKQNLLDLNYEDLKYFLSEKIGVEEKKLNMRAQQIFTATYQKGLNDFEKFTTIPIDLRKKLSKNISFNNSKIVETHESSDGTLKFLVELFDGNKVERPFYETIKSGRIKKDAVIPGTAKGKEMGR